MNGAASPLPADGPMPSTPGAAELVRPELSVSAIDGVLVLRPQGVLDTRGLRLLHDVLCREPSVPAVIDFRDCTLVNPALLDQIDPDRWERSASQVCVACRRSTGRHILRRSGVTDKLTLFQGVEDALQARTFADAGFGCGWQRA